MKNNKYSKLLILGISGLSSISQNTIKSDCSLFSCHEREMCHEDRAMKILRDFLTPELHVDRKWREWLDQVIEELKHVNKYKAFCDDLKRLKGEKDPLKVGKVLKKYDNILSTDLKTIIDTMYDNDPYKLYVIVSTRMKVK